jgi:putative DNA primase/helicase
MSAVVEDLRRAADAMPSVRLVRGDAVTLEPVRWVWRWFLPAGMLTVLGGAPGCGKTTIGLGWAAILTRGGQWPDGSRCAQPGDVIVWSGEDPPAVTAARLTASGADMKRVHFVDGVSDGGAFDPSRDVPLLEAAAQKLAAPRLLIIDPIVSAVAGDSHKSADVRRALQPVVDLAQRLGCAVLGITHFSKGTSGRDPVERVTGSIAFAALARLVLVAAKVKAEPGDEGEPRRVLLRAKSNIGPDDGGFAYSLERIEVAPEVEGQRVRWLEALEGTARELLADAEAEPDASEESSALDDAIEFLKSELGEAPKAAKAIFREARDAGHSERTIKRAKAVLQAESRKEKAGWVWALPVNDAKHAKDAKAIESRSPGTVGPLGPVAENVEVL